jgi:hypothetical protein
MKCPNCGYSSFFDFKVCKNCGYDVNKPTISPQTENEYFCTECGSQVKLEDKTCPKCGGSLEETVEQPHTEVSEKSLDEISSGLPVRTIDTSVIESLKKIKDWFAIARTNRGEQIFYDNENLVTTMRKNILDNIHNSNDSVEVHSKNKKGEWSSKNTTVIEFANGYFELGVLYKPIWTYAINGLKWGAIVGVLLKMFDTFILLLEVDGTIAVMFLVAVGVCFIPRIGIGAMIVVSFIMTRISKVNFFFMAIAAGLVGAILGCLPGMAIGGIAGFIRKNNLPHANDAHPEPSSLFITTVLLPAIGGATLLYFYIVVLNPWLAEILSK